MRRLVVVVALVTLPASACVTGWSDSYRSETMGRCSNTTAEIAGFSVTSWCECVINWREDHRSESEDRGTLVVTKDGKIDYALRSACRYAETAEITEALNKR